MSEMEMSRRPVPMTRATLVLVSVTLVALAAFVLLFVAARGGTRRTPARLHHASAPAREINLTTLSARELRPVGAQLDQSSIRLHPQLVRVAGVGTDDFTQADSQTSAPPSSSAAQAPSDAEVRKELDAFRQALAQAPGVPVGPSARVLPNGTAIAPADAPTVVAAVIQGGDEIAKTPYKWGGGHGAWADTGYDCSGSVSFALAGAGLLSSPLDSTQFERWGAPGPGRWITIYANPVHAFMVVAGLRFDTGGLSGPGSTRWQPTMRSTAGFVARHPPGL